MKPLISISSDGNTVAVGEPYGNHHDEFGSVVVFKNEKNGTPWSQVGQAIMEPSKLPVKAIGYNVVTSGDGLVVATVQGGRHATSYRDLRNIYVYSLDSKSDNWSPLGGVITGNCIASDPSITHNPCYYHKDDIMYHGLALSSDGKTIATASFVSVKNKNDWKRNNSVILRAFQIKNNKWIQVGEDIEIPADELVNPHPQDSRISLSHDGKTLAIGESFKTKEDSSKTEIRSSCRIYQLKNDNRWIQIGGAIQSIDKYNYHEYPVISLSEDGKTIAVAVHEPDNHKLMAKIRVYNLSDRTSTWVQVGEEISLLAANIYDLYLEIFSCVSMDLSGDGKSLVLGFPEHTKEEEGPYAAEGRYVLFRLDENSEEWNMVLDKVGESKYGRTGSIVSLSADGNKMVVSSPGEEKIKIYDFSSKADDLDNKPLALKQLRGSRDRKSVV